MENKNYEWKKEDCETLFYMREYLKMTYSEISYLLTREFKYKITRNSVKGKYTRLKLGGFSYKPLKVERV